MSEGQSPDRLTPEDLLPPPEATGPVGPREKRARDMATMVALLGLVLVAGGLMAILALVFNQLLIFAFLAAIVLGGGACPSTTWSGVAGSTGNWRCGPIRLGAHSKRLRKSLCHKVMRLRQMFPLNLGRRPSRLTLPARACILDRSPMSSFF